MEAFDYRALDFWWNVIQTAVLVFVAVYTWLVNRTKANREAITTVNEKMGGLQNRVTVIEHELEHVPSHNDLAEVYHKVNQVAGAISHMEGEIKQINQTLHLIQQYLLENNQ